VPNLCTVFSAKFGMSDCCPGAARKINCRPGIEYVMVSVCHELLFTTFPVFLNVLFIVKYTFKHLQIVLFTLRSGLKSSGGNSVAPKSVY